MIIQQEICLDFSCHQNYYKPIAIALLWQSNKSIPQEVNSVGKLEEVNVAIVFFIAKKQQKAILNFPFRFINCNGII